MPIIASGLIGELRICGLDPDNRVLGIFPMIVGPVYLTGLAMICVVPLGIGLAMFIQVFAPRPQGKILHWTFQFMTGTPTVV